MDLKIGDNVVVIDEYGIPHDCLEGRIGEHGVVVAIATDRDLIKIKFQKESWWYGPYQVETVKLGIDKKTTIPSSGCTCGAFVAYGAGRKSLLHSSWCDWK